MAIMDAGYDTEPIHDGCMDRGILPVAPLRETEASSRAGTSLRFAVMASGRSRERMRSAGEPNGAALRASVSLRVCGSRLLGCIL
jgi:hypothetical protein